MKKLNNIEFLIFDLGNVIIDIDYNLTFNKLNSRLEEIHHGMGQEFMVSDHHYDFETGKIDEKAFRDGIRKYFNQVWEDTWIDEVWNSLLIDIPEERLELLLELKNNYKLFMLSNTNSIHFKVVEDILNKKLPDHGFSDIFDRLFLSHEMGLRKPDVRIYQSVVEQIGAQPQQCLFFDDLEENLLGAKKVGIQTYKIDHPKALIRFFENVQ